MTCAHLALPDTSVSVARHPEPGEVVVECPCCHLGGIRDLGDTEPMTCPYCAAEAVTR